MVEEWIRDGDRWQGIRWPESLGIDDVALKDPVEHFLIHHMLTEDSDHDVAPDFDEASIAVHIVETLVLRIIAVLEN